MIGLLQSGTGIGSGMCLPIASSGLLARWWLAPEPARPRVLVAGTLGPLAAPPAVELPAGPAPFGPRAARDPDGPRRAPLCADRRTPVVAVGAAAEAAAGAAVEPAAAAVAVVSWPRLGEDDDPPDDVPDAPPGLVGSPACGLSVGVSLDALGVETVTGVLDTLSGAVDTLTSGVETVATGVDTVTAGTDAPTGEVDTATDGVDTVTPGTEMPTLGSDTLRSGSAAPTRCSEPASGARLGGGALEACSNPTWA
ncbi:MAG TPA: hypothetical protein VK721_13110 [Solirubrobacteraceae bacterium]|nr:hypothetical protein [Solirubrobacteraceae bacterium]